MRAKSLLSLLLCFFPENQMTVLLSLYVWNATHETKQKKLRMEVYASSWKKYSKYIVFMEYM